VPLVLSNATRIDILNASGSRRLQRQAQLKRYEVLPALKPDKPLADKAGFPTPISGNDLVDLEVLQALVVRAADWLVTEDITLRKRAVRAGFAGQVLGLKDAIETLNFYLKRPTQIPGVQTVKGYQLNLDAAIFGEIRVDYPEFSTWWREKVAREHRDVLLLGPLDDPEGLSVLKEEGVGVYAIPTAVIKVCTFKVSDAFLGSRRGELLLKASLDYARRNQRHVVYLEVLPNKQHLISWLESFGFERISHAFTARGEHVYVKYLSSRWNVHELSSLEHNVAFGPGSIRIQNPNIVPIKPMYHSRLLPEASPQLPLLLHGEACGNAIGKAYLSRAPTRRLQPGDTLMFMRSGENSAVTVIGVVESTLVSSKPEEIIAFVGNRTVYSVEEVRRLCERRSVLAVRFRLDRTLEPPWPIAELQSAGLVLRSPQSIQRTREEGLAWVRNRLVESL
jgi:ribosomal protein S18 acetylase RimI-like enzyme